MTTKIYICSNYHDNDCGIFGTLEKALSHLDNCQGCEVQEMELINGEFEFTSLPTIAYMQCSNCGNRWRSDQKESVVWEYRDFCDRHCKQETENFYANGNTGIHGQTTRQTIQYYADKIKAGQDPHEGLASTSSSPPPSMKIFTTQ